MPYEGHAVCTADRTADLSEVNLQPETVRPVVLFLVVGASEEDEEEGEDEKPRISSHFSNSGSYGRADRVHFPVLALAPAIRKMG